MQQNKPFNPRMIVFTAMFTALIVAGSYLSFPLPVINLPIVLADFFVMLAGLCLGMAWGAASVGMFLFLGALGLPVFAGGRAGLVVFMGPTGGYLYGYLAAVFLIGWISGPHAGSLGKPNWFRDLAALITGNLIIFGLGIPWLKLVLKLSWDKSLTLGLLPFLIGNFIKIIAALALIQVLRPLLKEFNVIPESGASDEPA